MSKILDKLTEEVDSRNTTAQCKVCGIFDKLLASEAFEVDKMLRIKPRPPISYERIAAVLRSEGHDVSEHALRRHRDRCEPRVDTQS